MTEKQLTKTDMAIMEIYRRQFKEADPSGDIDEMIKTGEAKEKDFFMKYYLSQERQNEILEEVCEEFKIKGWLKKQLHHSTVLGSSPTGSQKGKELHLNELKSQK